MAVSADNPGVGDPDGMDAVATLFATKASTIRSAASTITTTLGEADGTTWTGDARDSFVSSMTSTCTQLRAFGDELDAVHDAIHAYSAAVRRIKDEQQKLVATRNEAQQVLAHRGVDVATAYAGWTYSPSGAPDIDLPGSEARAQQAQAQANVDAATATVHQVNAQLDVMASDRQKADTQLVAALNSADVLGSLARFDRTTLSTDSAQKLLKDLATLTGPQLAALLALDPGLAQRIANEPVGAVSAWWASMNGADASARQLSSQQQALANAIPAVIGNLGGIPYWVRDKANRISLAAALAQEKNDPGKQDDYAGLQAIQKALKTPDTELVALDLSGSPLAQVVVGDLDTAKDVTYVVPGMGTTAKDMPNYVGTAVDLRKQDAKVSDLSFGDVAVVAWIGYHPPMPSTPTQEVSDEQAMVGAKSLENDLNDLYAMRGGDEPTVSVVAHSYGTDVTAIALTQTHADHVVLFGSPGIGDGITNVSQLNVPKGQVFASTGIHDGWASGGQAMSDLAVGIDAVAKASGSPSVIDLINGNGDVSWRVDPTSSSFGAHVFSSEAVVGPDGQVISYGVGQHGPFGSDGRFSYFNANTTALHDAAVATMGQGSSIPRGEGPAERAAQRLDPQWYSQETDPR